MSSLAELQHALSAHVLRLDERIAGEIAETPQVDAAARLAVYRDAYRLRLIEALDSNYPVLAQLLGTTSFAELSQQYINAHPSHHYSIRWFGDQLPAFLLTQYSHSPWLAQLALWEWLTAQAFDATDAAILTYTQLTQLAPVQWPALKLKFHPSLHRLKLDTNVVALIKASAAHQPLPAPASIDPIDWCIWRKDLSVLYRSVERLESDAIDAVTRGCTFGELCEVLATTMRHEAVPLHAATLLKTWVDDQWLCQD